ncbi:MAG: branched-chain amino acid ABC transporter permease [Dehalococcoidia bacterium]|jgi:branched-chain amino acid transport system permease protein
MGHTIAQIIVTILVKGGIYALLASGLALIYGVGRIINLAHTAFYMVAAYFYVYLTQGFLHSLGWGVPESIAVTVIGLGLLGVLVYRFLLDRIREHEAAVLLVTISIGMALQEIIRIQFGSLPVILPRLIEGTTTILGVGIVKDQLLTVGVVAGVIIVLWLLLTKTKLGISIRAVSNDAEIASVVGISVSRTLMVTMGIGTALAGVAAILTTSGGSIYYLMWLPPLMMVLVIVVLGGLGSFKGSFIGAFIIAFVEALVLNLYPNHGYLSQVFALVVMIIMLMVRPAGLFGTLFEEERL